MSSNIGKIRDDIKKAILDLRDARRDNKPESHIEAIKKDIFRLRNKLNDCTNESQQFSALKDILYESEKTKPAKKKLKKAAASVYHRDYMKTRNKPYRKYDPSDRES